MITWSGLNKMRAESYWSKIILNPDSGKEEKIQAGFHLENAIDSNSIKILGRALLTEKSPIVRHEFAFSLGETTHPKIAIPYLKQAVEKDENIFVRHEAILALATLGDKSVIPFIEQFLDEKEPLEIRESAKIALERLGSTD